MMRYPSFIPKPAEIPGIIPGLLLAVATALVAMILASFIPAIGASPIAIFLGIIAGNLYFKQAVFAKGTRFAEGRLLEYAIVLLGFSVTFSTLSELGLTGTIFIALQIIGTILLAIGIGKYFKFSQSYYLLMASGNAVCGSSAIAATAPVIGANEAERGLIITIVNLMGTVMMFLLPLIALAIYDQAMLQGAFIGGILQSVGQVIASASMLGTEVMRDATIFKIMRIASLVLIVLVFHQIAKRNKKEKSAPARDQSLAKRQSITGLIPWYLFGFMIACTLNSIEFIHEDLTLILLKTSGLCEVVALAAIGLRLNFGLLKQQGRKLAVYALILGAGQIALALLLIQIFLN
ncbi:putative sulfate exporter family transporter [Ignatzschineria rhizosphaerae]|uniref:Sulfate exporter family transporter n=1 Tax=Ignatzschineria rhizosphaerae TaxID=2923279 RepID=A0ABY3X0M2_9GAMM|nr:putative sulfate exporter family transporter [Ignatzschineria rhizosphaerae]UNM95224.1 putative sulfate exporter family transporter [Ignatzschineria rhizosphaerae]